MKPTVVCQVVCITCCSSPALNFLPVNEFNFIKFQLRASSSAGTAEGLEVWIGYPNWYGCVIFAVLTHVNDCFLRRVVWLCKGVNTFAAGGVWRASCLGLNTLDYLESGSWRHWRSISRRLDLSVDLRPRLRPPHLLPGASTAAFDAWCVTLRACQDFSSLAFSICKEGKAFLGLELLRVLSNNHEELEATVLWVENEWMLFDCEGDWRIGTCRSGCGCCSWLRSQQPHSAASTPNM